MQLWLGNYAFPVNGVDTTSHTRLVLSDHGRPLRYVFGVNVTAYLDGSGQADLTAKETLLRAQLLVPYVNLVLKQDSGAASATALVSNNSLSGVRVVDGPHFENQAGDGEYVVQRVARFTVEAEFLIPSGANAVVRFSESVSITGTGDAEVAWRYPVNARPVRQIVRPYTTIKATQRGTIVGHRAYLNPPPPLWPDAELKHLRKPADKESPRRIGPGAGGLVDFPVSYEYVFESGVPLIGLPTPPPF